LLYLEIQDLRCISNQEVVYYQTFISIDNSFDCFIGLG